MTGPRGTMTPEVGGLGEKVTKPTPTPAAPRPAPGIDPGKCIDVDQHGRLSTNDPRNEVANIMPATPADWIDIKIAVVLLCLLAPLAALAQQPPTCYVTTGARGYTMGTTPDGTHAAWWCLAGPDWRMVRLVARAGYALRHPVLPPNTPTADYMRAYWLANVGQGCASRDAAVNRLCDAAANAANETKPLPPFVVRTNSTATTRPTYPLINGVRGTTSNGTVPVLDAGGRPTACNPAQAAGSYMQVKAPGTVALCSAT